MTAKTGKELTLDWFERVWNQQDIAAIPELMAEDCIIHGLSLGENGSKAFAQFHAAYCQAFENIHIEVFEVVEEDMKTIGNCRFTALHKGSGKDVEMVFSFSVKWENQKAVEARNVVDFTTMLAQLELFDPSQMSKALEV